MVFSVVDKARARFPELEVCEWNLAKHPELGPRYGVMATPAIAGDTLIVRGQHHVFAFAAATRAQ